MLLEADLPDDVDALRALVLEQAHELDILKVFRAENERLQAIIDALEQGTEPRCSGDNIRKALEIGIALRESHRRDHAPVKLPLQDRSLKIVPHKGRWLSKKDLYGKEWYAEQIGTWTKGV